MNRVSKILKKLLLSLGLLLPLILQACSNHTKHEVSLDEKIGQLIIVGFKGYKVNDEIKTYINKYHIGGVILINKGLTEGRVPNIDNPQQLLKLNNDLLKLDKTLFISLDQEGGMVARLRASNGFEGSRNLSHYEIGKLAPQAQAKAAKGIAELVQKYKFNVNFAPVIDIDNKNNPIIGKINRSFSDNPEKIYQDAKIYIKAHHDANIITSIKHFPGHGSSLKDSHLGIVDITETWSDKELLPYKLLLENDKYNDMVMVAHTFNTKIDAKYPASLSKSVITGMLREKMGYKGVVITDSLDMRAIEDHYGLQETVIAVLNAGADILLYTNNGLTSYHENVVQDIHKIIKDAVLKNQISEDRINEAYNRVIALKKSYGLIK